MNPEDFDFDLPAALIAQAPPAERSSSRLLHLSTHGLTDRRFTDLPDLLRPDDLLVVNESRVVPARLFGRKASGGRIEMLLERLLSDDAALVQLRASHPPLPGVQLAFDGGMTATVVGRRDAFFELRFAGPLLPELERHGHVPLPPYIRRPDLPADRERYQTVYARDPGSVAAPTAGLHFDSGLLAALANRGIGRAAVSLHVGAGTFSPLRPEQLALGRLHAEQVAVPQATVDAIANARARGGRVVAVGTTVVRALETAASGGNLAPLSGETQIFIRPGHRFIAVDALVTNFHLPKSSLLMLVAAFAGTARVLTAYQHAVRQGYRFFSYGDAMFIESGVS